jgi:hypothetical protein
MNTSATSNVLPLETLATRLSFSEMRAIEAAAEAGGITRSQWLRSAAVAYLNQSSEAHPRSIELTVLTEVMGLRLLVLNLFPAATPGLALETLRQIMIYAETAKHIEAAKVVHRSNEKRVPQ